MNGKRKMTKEDAMLWYQEKMKKIKSQAKDGSTEKMMTRMKFKGDSGTSVHAIVIGVYPEPSNISARIKMDVMFLNKNAMEINDRVENGINDKGKPTYSYDNKYTLQPFQHIRINVSRQGCNSEIKLGLFIKVTAITHISFNDYESCDVGMISVSDDTFDLFKLSATAFRFPENERRIAGESKIVLPIINEADSSKIIMDEGTFTMCAPPSLDPDNFQFKTLKQDIEPAFIGVHFTATYFDRGEPEMVVINMPIYSDQLETLGISGLSTWKDMGPTIMEFWKGSVYAYIDWKKTRSLSINFSGGNEMYSRAMEIRGKVQWDMRYILEHAGFKISETMAKTLISDYVVNEQVAVDNYYSRNPSIGIYNLREYNGNVDSFFNSPNDYTFYALCNLPRKDIEYVKEKKTSDEDLMQVLQDDRDATLRVRFTGQPYIIVFVVKN